MRQKHYIDIQNIREEDTELRKNNTGSFHAGDIVQVTEKIDGSNAMAAYDAEKDKMFAFSRKQELTCSNTLNGFWDFIQNLSEHALAQFKAHPEYRVFGEWCAKKNKIVYEKISKTPWYLFDIYDVEEEKWLTQDIVRDFARRCGFEYIHELYTGPFLDWKHVRSFMHSPAYGDRQEGVVCKNQTMLSRLLEGRLSMSDTDKSRAPLYLKIVNDDFKESMKTREKVIDPERENAKAEAQKIMESIITKNRIEKELFKMQNEGILPEKIAPEDFKLVAKTLPKRIYADLVKEENELLTACGEFGGKMCGSITMKIAREIVK
jgi:ATP-dependent RNA circularization protein (DNA/RNA ligase family)